VTVNLTNINPWLHLSSQHASIFGYYVLWLLRSPLHPFVDLSKPLRAELLGSDDAVEEEIDMPDSGQFSITMSALSNPTLDHDPGVLPPARRLLHAYFLGLSLGVPHFQDAAMNTVCFIFAPRTTPPPALIEEVYEKSGPEVVGLKKLCIDYYIFWRLFFHQDISDLARWKEDRHQIREGCGFDDLLGSTAQGLPSRLLSRRHEDDQRYAHRATRENQTRHTVRSSAQGV
jgi:hypothetical protein